MPPRRAHTLGPLSLSLMALSGTARTRPAASSTDSMYNNNNTHNCIVHCCLMCIMGPVVEWRPCFWLNSTPVCSPVCTSDANSDLSASDTKSQTQITPIIRWEAKCREIDLMGSCCYFKSYHFCAREQMGQEPKYKNHCTNSNNASYFLHNCNCCNFIVCASAIKIIIFAIISDQLKRDCMYLQGLSVVCNLLNSETPLVA
jgi:hypothetical protein